MGFLQRFEVLRESDLLRIRRPQSHMGGLGVRYSQSLTKCFMCPWRIWAQRDLEESLSGALHSDVHKFVADVVKSFDTVDGSILDYLCP